MPPELRNFLSFFRGGIDLGLLPRHLGDSTVERSGLDGGVGETPVHRGMQTSQPRNERSTFVTPEIFLHDTRRAVVGEVTKQIFDNVLVKAVVEEMVDNVIDG